MRAVLNIVVALLLFGGCLAQLATEGGCPGSNPLTDSCPFNSEASCDKDRDCPGKQLCCGCPRECRDPRGPALPQVGNCPIVFELPLSECARRSVPNTCRNDNQCSSGESCCPTECGGRSCRSTGIGVADFPDFNGGFYQPNTRCPAVDKDVDCRARFPAFECNSDRDCDGNRSCCPTECGGRGCARLRRPTTPTRRPRPTNRPRKQRYNKTCPIKLPKTLPPICARTSVVADCMSNKDCGNRQMCCPSSQCGGGHCVPKTRNNNNLKRCPAVPRVKPAICSRVRVARLCNKRKDCTGNKRCCRGVCGGTSCV